MKVRFLKNIEAEMKSSRTCGDGCCSYDKWTTEFFSVGEETVAVAEKSNFLPDGTIVLDGLKFGEDYTIIEFP